MSSGHGSRRKKHEEHEEHENHERWLVSYADMVTLLMVLFVVMFAMSQVDEKKYAQLLEESHRHSHTDRNASDLKVAEAERILAQLKELEQSPSNKR